jgi:hypothetical protein
LESARRLAADVSKVVRFRLGHAPDVGHLAGFRGITPLVLQGDLFTARVVDPEAALQELRRAGFTDVAFEPDGTA